MIDYFNIAFEKNQAIDFSGCKSQTRLYSTLDHLLQYVNWDPRNVISTPDVLIITSGPHSLCLYSSLPEEGETKRGRLG